METQSLGLEHFPILLHGPIVATNADLFTLKARADRLAQILDLFAEDSWRNVYAGQLEVRPPGAPTIGGPDGAAPPPVTLCDHSFLIAPDPQPGVELSWQSL